MPVRKRRQKGLIKGFKFRTFIVPFSSDFVAVKVLNKKGRRRTKSHLVVY